MNTKVFIIIPAATGLCTLWPQAASSKITFQHTYDTDNILIDWLIKNNQ